MGRLGGESVSVLRGGCMEVGMRVCVCASWRERGMERKGGRDRQEEREGERERECV